MKAAVSNSVFTHFQVDSFKRLFLLAHLIEPVYKSHITQATGQFKGLLNTKLLENYHDLNKMLNNVSEYI